MIDQNKKTEKNSEFLGQYDDDLQQKSRAHNCAVNTCDERLNIEYRLSPIFWIVAIANNKFRAYNLIFKITIH